MQPITVTNWPSAVVMVVVILAPGILAWLTSRKNSVKMDENKERLEQNACKLEEVAETLQEPHDGGTVRDALNRIETTVHEVEAQVTKDPDKG